MADSWFKPSANDSTYKVRLQSSFNLADIVVFEVTPRIGENQAVSYEELDPVHMPGTFLAYKTTRARTFELSGVKLVSRTPREARQNMWRVNTLRGWTKPYYGQVTELMTDFLPNNGNANSQMLQKNQTTASSSKGTGSVQSNPSVAQAKLDLANLLGAPPTVLLLSAYSKRMYSNALNARVSGNMDRIPVVIENLSIDWPDDVDYIHTEGDSASDLDGGLPFPVLMTVSLSLRESHSPAEYEQFSLEDYKRGRLVGF